MGQRHDTFFTDPDFLMGLKIEQSRPQQRGVTMKVEVKNKIQSYNHKGLNSLYWLEPNTKSVFLLNFKLQKFIKETIDSKITIPQFV